MNLGIEISSWDGKSAADIGKIYDQHCQYPAFTVDLIRLIEKSSTQKGATWVLKKYFESGKETAKFSSSIFENLLRFP